MEDLSRELDFAVFQLSVELSSVVAQRDALLVGAVRADFAEANLLGAALCKQVSLLGQKAADKGEGKYIPSLCARAEILMPCVTVMAHHANSVPFLNGT